MLEQLKEDVLAANLLLSRYGLIVLTWGNVSAIDRRAGLVVIKPSGMEYSEMKAEDMVVVDLDGNIEEGVRRPSSDLATHLELYRNFKNIGGIVHTHSRMATAFAQAERSIPCYGTTHADYFYGEIPVTRKLTPLEIKNDYELNTGKVIVESFKTICPEHMPAVLVSKHGPFTWGKNALNAVENALVLEEVAEIAYRSISISSDITPAQKDLTDKHFFRKHGKNAYYGQINIQ